MHDLSCELVTFIFVVDEHGVKRWEREAVQPARIHQNPRSIKKPLNMVLLVRFLVNISRNTSFFRVVFQNFGKQRPAQPSS